MKRALPFLIIAVVLAAAGAIAWSMKQSAVQPPVVTRTPNASAPVIPPKVGEPGAEPLHSIGDAKAPVTLEEFGDFQCPPCGLLHPVLKTMEHEFGPRLRIIFREFPLVPTHQHALAAARAAEAARAAGAPEGADRRSDWTSINSSVIWPATLFSSESFRTESAGAPWACRVHPQSLSTGAKFPLTHSRPRSCGL